MTTSWKSTVYVNKSILFKMAAECFACILFHFIGSISPTPWANGLALIVLVYFTAKISGSHLNPAVSTTFMLLGHINPVEMLLYWFAQFIGCIIGVLWIVLLVPQLDIKSPIPQYDLGYSGCFIPMSSLSHSQVYGWEAFCTFCFIIPVFAVVWYTQSKSGYGNTGPLIVGFSLMVNAFVAGPFTGAALNPARVIASPIVLECPNNDYIVFYVLGEFTGAILAPLLIIPWYGVSKDSWYFSILPHTSFPLPSFPLNALLIRSISNGTENNTSEDNNVRNTPNIPSVRNSPAHEANVTMGYRRSQEFLVLSPKHANYMQHISIDLSRAEAIDIYRDKKETLSIRNNNNNVENSKLSESDKKIYI